MAQDPVEAYLRKAPATDAQRADLWDAYHDAVSPDDLATKLQAIKVPDQVKVGLWDLKASSTPKIESPQTEAPKTATWSDRLGLNDGTDSVLGGFLRGSAGAAVDMVQGAASDIGTTLRNKLQADNAPPEGMSVPTSRVQPAARQMPAALMTEKPDTTAGTVGTYLPAVAALAAPVGGAVKAGVEALPSVTRAGEKFQNVMGAARNIPIDVKDVGEVALRINQLAERGGSMPMAVRKLLNRMTDPEKAGMVYEESRDFASNISRLSANEFGRLTPAVAREVAELRVALNKANAEAAQKAGKLKEYAAAMTEYQRAMKLRSAVNSAIEGAKRYAPIASAAGAGAWLTKKVVDAIGGE
ncbi:MAG: hypothetical protein RLY20_3166 [Verrucomicrobiota bacterium]|jgi:hypothetical protein